MTKNLLSATRIRQIILEQSKRAHKGHIGSALSVADIVATLYSVMNIPTPDDPDRDRFVLSKGHAALALYAALHLKGWIDEPMLNTFCANDSLLGVHPEQALIGVDFSTGSLGHGLSMAVGAALAARLQNSSRRIFALLSDAECNEGSLWEAVQFAAHHRLSNLIAVIDLNGQQALDYTDRILNISPIEDRWKAFGWDVHTVNGHDVQEMATVIEQLDTQRPDMAPHVLVAHTTFGKGVSYMTNQIKWHYWPMSDEEYQQALQDVENGL